jgi:putative CocE/NonD family hydrolase
MTPRAYMTDDQRFATRRPDVLSFQSEVLESDVTLVGPMTARLNVSTTGTDADWVVKLIDVYPSDHPREEHAPEGVEFGDYEQLVRGEILRGRFRDGFEEPEPFEPGAVTRVDVPLQDVFHTFKKGHRILVHVQSTWFPLFDRNPQSFVPNIFEADEEDFTRQTHRVYHSAEAPSYLDVLLLPGEPD